MEIYRFGSYKVIDSSTDMTTEPIKESDKSYKKFNEDYIEQHKKFDTDKTPAEVWKERTGESKKPSQDFDDIIPILLKSGLNLEINPVSGQITVHINHGNTRQLILKRDASWSLN